MPFVCCFDQAALAPQLHDEVFHATGEKGVCNIIRVCPAAYKAGFLIIGKKIVHMSKGGSKVRKAFLVLAFGHVRAYHTACGLGKAKDARKLLGIQLWRDKDAGKAQNGSIGKEGSIDVAFVQHTQTARRIGDKGALPLFIHQDQIDSGGEIRTLGYMRSGDAALFQMVKDHGSCIILPNDADELYGLFKPGENGRLV